MDMTSSKRAWDRHDYLVFVVSRVAQVASAPVAPVPIHAAFGLLLGTGLWLWLCRRIAFSGRLLVDLGRLAGSSFGRRLEPRRTAGPRLGCSAPGTRRPLRWWLPPVALRSLSRLWCLPGPPGSLLRACLDRCCQFRGFRLGLPLPTPRFHQPTGQVAPMGAPGSSTCRRATSDWSSSGEERTQLNN